MERNVIYFSRTSYYARDQRENSRRLDIIDSIYMYRKDEHSCYTLLFFFFFFLKKEKEKNRGLHRTASPVVTNFVFKLKRLSFALRLYYDVNLWVKERQESVMNKDCEDGGEKKYGRISSMKDARKPRYVMFLCADLRTNIIAEIIILFINTGRGEGGNSPPVCA